MNKNEVRPFRKKSLVGDPVNELPFENQVESTPRKSTKKSVNQSVKKSRMPWPPHYFEIPLILYSLAPAYVYLRIWISDFTNPRLSHRASRWIMLSPEHLCHCWTPCSTTAVLHTLFITKGIPLRRADPRSAPTQPFRLQQQKLILAAFRLGQLPLTEEYHPIEGSSLNCAESLVLLPLTHL